MGSQTGHMQPLKTLSHNICWNQLPNSVDFTSLVKFKNSLDAIDCSLLTG